MADHDRLFEPLELPCGVVLRNRLAKAAMSDSLGDGRGDPTASQGRLYERWAQGGLALSIVGEVQVDRDFAEKPGNLVLDEGADATAFAEFTTRGTAGGCALWAQLGHAGAMAYPPISTPRGPSALALPGLRCAELSVAEIEALPERFASAAVRARDLGFGGVEVHAAHGFLLSQFLSPLFNRREDAYGGPLAARMRPLLDSIAAVRAAVGPGFPVAVKLNATDELAGGFAEDEALEVVDALDGAGIDLLDISGGTYFPGASAASDRTGDGAYFAGFARRAREGTGVPLMLTGGFKTRAQAAAAVADGTCDVVGLARAVVLDPELPSHWRQASPNDPRYPRFVDPPEGGITAWYTMRLTALGEASNDEPIGLAEAVAAYAARDARRVLLWNARRAGRARPDVRTGHPG